MVGIDIVAMMMLIRIFALYYHNQKIVVYGVASLLVVQIAVNTWLLTRGTGMTRVSSCTVFLSLTALVSSWIASSTAWIPLIYDTVALVLTVYKTLPQLFNKTGKIPGTFEIMRRMLEDGLLYYRQVCLFHFSHNAYIPDGTIVSSPP
ncbi:hypothetical protein K435DRAFT_650917 [Dendrothele bispora CBS 962.96]|uniref:Uncharacterized protein n=1 Tax=Dendrothele bispora (strain CBS 962.96) TaxID=1314807 RepID=A0A4S8ML76_DENBC|nr:hypothetical protein K435DRAFT_650917 [Dendrothele bispora CBS 962.96]